MHVFTLLSDTARRHPARPALWFRDRWFTYAEANARARGVAHFLRQEGALAGDRIAIHLENSPDYVAVHFAVHALDGVEVSLNVELKGSGIRELLENCGARFLVTTLRTVHRWRVELSSIAALEKVLVVDQVPSEFEGPEGSALVSMQIDSLVEDVTTSAEAVPVPAAAPDSLAAIVYTSGSTGEPKGVMLSHRNLVSNTRAIADYLELRPDDRMMVVLPFHYIYGRSLLYSHFLTGGALLIDNRFAFPTSILDSMEALGATCFAGVPSTYSILLHKTNVRERQFPKLRLLQQAGGGMAVPLQQEVQAAFPDSQLFVMYGSTEAAPRLTYVPPARLPTKWGSIGIPVPGVEVIVASESGEECAPGETGEVAARGPNIMLGYWNDLEGTARVLRNGYYFTGDLGYKDADGYIFLTGRSKDMIKTGGNRVSAKEVEDALIGVVGIQEAAVIPVPDTILGEAIRAYVVASNPELTDRQVRAALSATLPPFKIPREFVFRDSLPKNSSGKVMKATLASSSRD